MIVAVVEAMPLVVNVALYGPASPVSRSSRSLRIGDGEVAAGDLVAAGR